MSDGPARSVLVIQPDPQDGPGLLGDVLARRDRPTIVLRPHGVLPPLDRVRAVAVLGWLAAPASTVTEVGTWLRACRNHGVPLLAMSEGTQLLGDTPPVTEDTGGLLKVRHLPDGAEDPVFGDIPPGSVWPVTAPALSGWEETAGVLRCDDDDAPVAVRLAEQVYVTRLAPYRSAAHSATHLPDLADTLARGAVFHDALAAAVVGRWVDEVVGRTEEETPWGRKGPAPLPRPGLYLHAAGAQEMTSAGAHPATRPR